MLSPSETKKCPKCSGEMAKDKQLASYTELTLRRESEFIGDRIVTFYCRSCGYIEFYKDVKRARYLNRYTSRSVEP